MAKTFTLPSSDYDLIDTIKKKCFLFGANPNQSEIVRAGLQSLNKL